VYFRGFFTDAYTDARVGRLRPDLCAQALRSWDALPVEPGYVFRSVGPATGIADSSGRADSGLVATIAVGADPAHLTVGTRGGGVWGSVDEGQSWAALGDSLPSLQTPAVGRFDEAGRPPLLVAGSGETDEAMATDPTLLGVFRSIDGGKTWSVIDAGLFGSHFRSQDVNRVLPLDGTRLLVATRVGLYFSKDGGRNFGDDAEHRNGRPVLRGHVTDVLVEPGSSPGSLTLAAAVGAVPPASDEPSAPELAVQMAVASVPAGLYVTTLSTAGLTPFGSATRLTQVSNPEVPSKTLIGHRGRFWVLSASRLDSLVQDLSTRPASTLHSMHVTARTPLGSGGWSEFPTADTNGLAALQTSYSHAIALEPSATATAFNGWFGSVELMKTAATASSGSWRLSSSDGGTSAEAVHSDIHAIRVDDLPGPVRRVLAAGDGGIALSTDAGASWTTRNHHVTALCWSVSLARVSATEARLLCGIQDNGTAMGTGPFDTQDPASWTWIEAAGGDGGANALIPRDSTHFAGDDPQQAWVTFNGSFGKADAANTPPWSGRRDPEGTTSPRGFIYSETLALGRDSAGNWTRLYFGNSHLRNGRGTLRRRDTAGFTFVAPPAAYNPGNTHEFGAMITALAAAPLDAAADRVTPGAWNLLWIGLANGDLWCSRDAGASLVARRPPVGRFPVSAIAIDPENSQRVAVTFAGFTETATGGPSQHVFLSEDGGALWRDISGRRGGAGFVPDIPVLAASFTRTTPPALVISTSIGVLMTQGPAFGERWTRVGINLPKCACSAISVLNDMVATPPPALSRGLPPIAVGTFGRGAFLLARPAAAEAHIDFDGGFGAMRVGETRRRSISVHNVGNAALALGSPSVAPPFFLVAAPSGNIAARSSTVFSIECRPTAAGPFNADCSIAGKNVALSCEAFVDGPPRLSLEPRQVHFGTVGDGTTAEETITLQNLGQSELRISGIAPVGTPSARFVFAPTIPPDLVLAPGESRPLTLRFQASGTGSAHAGVWQLQSNDPIADTSHFQFQARGDVGPHPPAEEHGIPGWVPWLVGGVVVGGICIGVGYYLATRPSSPAPAGGP
jgi:hypothetical protein